MDKTTWVTRLIGGRSYYATVPASTSTGVNCVLGNGNQGVAVKAVQSAMNLPDNGRQGLNVDGIWGTRTTTAMRNVQTLQQAYPVDGIYGPVTRDKMYWQWTLGSVA
jgi:peptidoglycan hydrolase-like protein with peptidoglycan-binding domain